MGAVYFAHADGRIKVGFTDGPVLRRLSDISRYLPSALRLIGHIPGDRALEASIHKQLRAVRLKGEWFRDCAECREVIYNLMETARAAATPAIVEPPGRAKTRATKFSVVWKAWYPKKPAEELAARCNIGLGTAQHYLRGSRKISFRVLKAAMDEVMSDQ